MDISSFLRSAPGKLNAYNWLKVLSESEKNILLLIDGYLPSRFHGKKGLARDLECRAGLEIIACGRPGQNNNAEKAINPFVEQLILQMEDLIARAAKKTFRSRAALSLPQLLKRATLDNNPVRLWLSTCAPEYVKEDGETREKDKVVPRLRICPRYVKAHGKIAFHCDIIRDTKKARRATAAQRRAAKAKAKARASAEKGVAYVLGLLWEKEYRLLTGFFTATMMKMRDSTRTKTPRLSKCLMMIWTSRRDLLFDSLETSGTSCQASCASKHLSGIFLCASNFLPICSFFTTVVLRVMSFPLR